MSGAIDDAAKTTIGAKVFKIKINQITGYFIKTYKKPFFSKYVAFLDTQ